MQKERNSSMRSSRLSFGPLAMASVGRFIATNAEGLASPAPSEALGAPLRLAPHLWKLQGSSTNLETLEP
eukprot:3734004-Alexandrium_andersonii.AAC.1